LAHRVVSEIEKGRDRLIEELKSKMPFNPFIQDVIRLSSQCAGFEKLHKTPGISR
ncbi:hypothetical protein HYY75_08875, partial [bacterium]|nr:hypothetical protein [bacterium]